jgi:16S rRNA G1207 methylase RsmC
LQALEQQRLPVERKPAIVLAVGKAPEQVEQEIAEIRTWLPADQLIMVIDI